MANRLDSKKNKEAESLRLQESGRPGSPNLQNQMIQVPINLEDENLDIRNATTIPVYSFHVGEDIEVLSQDSGLRGCWFRCKILKASGKSFKVIHKDVEDVEGTGKLEEWVVANRVCGPDKLGMRCLGRHIVRPFPAINSSNDSFIIGAAVDAWWGDGWWEGVVVGTNIGHGKYDFRVYFPGENHLRYFQRKDLRASQDWFDNNWIEVNPNPDILSVISSPVDLAEPSLVEAAEKEPVVVTEKGKGKRKVLAVVLGLPSRPVKRIKGKGAILG